MQVNAIELWHLCHVFLCHDISRRDSLSWRFASLFHIFCSTSFLRIWFRIKLRLSIIVSGMERFELYADFCWIPSSELPKPEHVQSSCESHKFVSTLLLSCTIRIVIANSCLHEKLHLFASATKTRNWRRSSPQDVISGTQRKQDGFGRFIHIPATYGRKLQPPPKRALIYRLSAINFYGYSLAFLLLEHRGVLVQMCVLKSISWRFFRYIISITYIHEI